MPSVLSAAKSTEETVQLITQLEASRAKIIWDSTQPRPLDTYLIGDNELAKSFLWCPTYTLKKG